MIGKEKMASSYIKGSSDWILGGKKITEREVKHWHRLPREVGGSPPWRYLKDTQTWCLGHSLVVGLAVFV